MAYTPTEWKNGDTITAEKLNNLENGAQEASVSGGSDFFIVTFTTNNNTHTADKSYAEVYSAYEEGKLIIFYYEGCCALAAFGVVGTERFEANLTRIISSNPQIVEAIAIKYTGMYGGWIDIDIKELAVT